MTNIFYFLLLLENKKKHKEKIYAYILIMSCDIKINSIIFEIEKVSHIFQSPKKSVLHKELFIFIGNQLSSSIKKTLESLNNKGKVTKSDLNELKKKYSNYYESWMSALQSLKKKEQEVKKI